MPKTATATKAPVAKTPIATVKMTLDKETAGTYRFRAEDDDAPVTTIYVAKGLYDSTPTTVTVTLS